MILFSSCTYLVEQLQEMLGMLFEKYANDVAQKKSTWTAMLRNSVIQYASKSLIDV